IDFPTSLTVLDYQAQSLFELESIIYFANNSAEIPEAGQKIIQTLTKEIKSRTDYSIRVEGHAEPSEQWIHPRENDTWTLSMMRAVAVVRQFEKAGIPSKRLVASGRGEYQPMPPADSIPEGASNRRVVLYLSPTQSLTQTQ
ncbi:MAG: OmpA family protein, partial [Bacteroidota bacterium]